jgi:nucleoside 2-deoxyribosyltransferase
MRVFLASPFSGYLVSDGTGVDRLDPHLSALLLRIESTLQEKGHSVFLSQRREEFGAKLWSAHQCTPFDLLEMQRADCVVALPDKSYGVHVELGWATALGKPLVLVVDESGQFTSPIVQGLECVGHMQTVVAGANLLQDVNCQLRLCERLMIALAKVYFGLKREVCAFLSTGFGFGPVSKATTIARELRKRAPYFEMHYFGAGIDYDFARKSRTFDRNLRIDVDDPGILRELIPLLDCYAFVVSVLNLDILRLWPERHPPLFLVDSLAWLWSGPPPGVNNAKAYFVQDYLVPEDRVENWRRECRLVPVGPILHDLAQRKRSSSGPSILLVNFSGCANPYTASDLFERYVEVLALAILDHAEDFDEVIFCCNERLSQHLVGLLKSHNNVAVGHLSHDEFIDVLARSSAVLTAPGITTTLEANALGKSIRFLLPQNYSQAIMSEQYRTALGERCGMALSRFAPTLEVPAGLPEEEGIARVITSLNEILQDRRNELRDMIRELLRDQIVSGPLRLPINALDQRASGQHTIVEHMLADQVSVV